MAGLVPAVDGDADWAPLAEFVAVDEFERIGTFCEMQNWEQYTEMLTQWASATDSFETTVRRISSCAVSSTSRSKSVTSEEAPSTSSTR